MDCHALTQGSIPNGNGLKNVFVTSIEFLDI